MLGERLKTLRVSQGMTQTQLADSLGISTSAIGMYEQGRRSPDAAKLTRICGFFQVSADYFLIEELGKSAAGDIFDYLSRLEKQMLASGELTANGKKLKPFEILKISKAMSFAVNIILDELSENAKETQ